MPMHENCVCTDLQNITASVDIAGEVLRIAGGPMRWFTIYFLLAAVLRVSGSRVSCVGSIVTSPMSALEMNSRLSRLYKIRFG